MSANPDFSDLLRAFNDAGVEYLIVGAHAVMLYTEPRYTKDFDVWVRPSQSNAERVFRALAGFGAPLADTTPEHFTNVEVIYQIGVQPNRVDVMMDVAGLTFDEAWSQRTASTYGGTPTQYLSKGDVLRAKRAAGRPHDLRDIEWLEAEEGT